MLIKKIFQLLWARAPLYQIHLEIGVYFLRKGAVYQVGQPFVIHDKHGKRKRYISNLYYNFRQNKISHSFSPRPIPGLTEQFKKEG